MKTVNIASLSSVMDAMEKGKKPSKVEQAALADALYNIKVASDALGELATRGKEIFKKHNFDIVESDNVLVMATIRAGSMRYDTEKLNSYFAKIGADANKYKKQSADSYVMQYKAK